MDIIFKSNPKGNCKLCKNPDEWDTQVNCIECDRWLHLKCLKLEGPVKKYVCPKCYTIAEERKGNREALMQTERLLKEKTEAEKRTREENERCEKEIERLEDILRNEEIHNQSDTTHLQDDLQTLTTNVNKMANLGFAPRKKTVLKLPDFYGNYRTWPRFKLLFEETTRTEKFTNLENLTRLQIHLKGDALRSVSGLMLNPSNVDAILERLGRLYGNPVSIFNALLKDLMVVKRASLENPSSIIEFCNALNNMVENMTMLNQTEYLMDQRLLTDLVAKLSPDLKTRWLGNSLNEEGDKIKTLKDFSKWLKPTEDVAITLLAMEGGQRDRPARLNTHYSASHQISNKSCLICSRPHETISCYKLKNASVNERWKMLKEKNVCTNCCKFSNHAAINCRSRPQCTVDGCGQRHNTILHEEKFNSMGAASKAHLNFHQNSEQYLFQVLPITVYNENNSIETFALIDPGSSTSLMTESLRQKLNLHGPRKPLTLSWTNGCNQVEDTSTSVSLKLRGPNGRLLYVKDIRTVNELDLPTQSINANVLKRKFSHLKTLNISSYKNAKPTILLGLPHAYYTQAVESKSGAPNEPVAHKTRIGWVVFGKCRDGDAKENQHLFTIQDKKEEEEKSMRDLMKRFFSTEEFGERETKFTPKSKDHERALSVMNDTLKYTNNQYEIGLLWKDPNVSLPSSYAQALRRLESQERKMKGNDEMKTWYKNQITDYVQKGYARKLTPFELLNRDPKINYIPHFMVINPNKPTPKPRLVFDAAAKNEGISLNSTLLSGPDATTSIFGVLIRFREYPIACSGDIKEMFHQIRIRKEDQVAQRFLFRDNPRNEPQVYVMNVMTFGATCSPAFAQFVKNENALKYKDKYPTAVEAIVKNHYVDDYLDSFRTINDAIKTINEVCLIHDRAHFFMRNFVSNCQEVIRSIPDDRSSQQELLHISNKI